MWERAGEGVLSIHISIIVFKIMYSKVAYTGYKGIMNTCITIYLCAFTSVHKIFTYI